MTIRGNAVKGASASPPLCSNAALKEDARARRGWGRTGEARPDWPTGLQARRSEAGAGRSRARAQNRLCARGSSSPFPSRRFRLGTERGV